MNKIIGIVFKENGKIYNFIGSDDNYIVGTRVIVETEKGQQLGKVVSITEEDKNVNDMKPILRIATDKDYDHYLESLKLANNALLKAREEVKNLDLDMNLLTASYTFDRKQLLFNFIANERIDFRELVKKLAYMFHTRIELRQIGVRDKAKEIGGIGQCGRQLCCATFINNIDPITINMAKNQNIALNPTKINGACGRLLCCLTYEDGEYSACKKNLPQVGYTIDSEYGRGVVTSVDVLNRKYKINVGNETYEITQPIPNQKEGK